MKLSKHTPGPWEVKRSEEYSETYCLWKSKGEWVTGLTEDQEEANRALIEAAPDMLEALEYLKMTAVFDLKHIRVIDAAVSKAKGVQE